MAKIDPLKDLLPIYGGCADLNGNTAAFPSASTGFDMTNFEDCFIIVGVGVTSATCDVTVLTSDATNGTYAAVSNATMTLVGTDDSKVFVGNLNLTGRNRWVRVTPTVSAASHLGFVCVIGVNPRVAPVTQGVTTSTKTFNV